MESDGEVETLCKTVEEKAMSATKGSLAIKTSEFNFYKSFDKFDKMIGLHNSLSLTMLSSLIQTEGQPKIDKLVSDEDKYEIISELNDNIFDRIGNYLDEASGLKKKEADLVLATISSDKQKTVNTSSWNRNIIKAKRMANKETNLLSAKMIERSQLKFKDKIDNSNKPFVPIIKDKPNSLKPLSILVEKTEDGFESYSHPYEFEIEKLEPNEEFLKIEIPEMPKPVLDTAFQYIDKKTDLIRLVETLNSCKIFAVDLEHHSYRTFQGFTCLMQISTKTCDYIIDTIELRSEMHLLNEVFTKPSILKVFHGADMDVVWMQRDFGLYLVNLFDTYQAAKLLELPHLSLSYLLKQYCNLEANKQFQLADWRMRPLNQELIKYAREDTHYLIFIYIQMKNELIAKGNKEKNLLRAVFDRSRNVCLKKYEKPLFNNESYRLLLKKSRVTLNTKQLYALQELYAWRDRMARNEDESIGYVLPNHMLLNIAEVLPREYQGILASCNPVPPLVKQQLNEIHLIILKAREKPLIARETVEKTETNSSRLTSNIDLDDVINCRYDRFPIESDVNVRPLIDDMTSQCFLVTDRQINRFSIAHKHIDRMDTEESEDSKTIADSNPKSVVFNFFKPIRSSKDNEKLEKIRLSFVSLSERYNQTLDSKRKTNDSDVNKNRVYSHYLNLKTNAETNAN